MRNAAMALRTVLEMYPIGFIIGPGQAKQWNLEDLWYTGAMELLDIMKPSHFHIWSSEDLWGALERAPDGWHGVANATNNQVVARHFARAIDYAVSSHFLMKAFRAPGIDGDRLGKEGQEVQI